MLTDRQGNNLNGANAGAADLYDRAIDAFNVYRGDPVALADEAMRAAPEFAMAHILKAYLFGVATEPAAAAEAKTILSAARHLASSDREKSHIAALGHLLANDWTRAAIVLDYHNMRFPHDLLGLQAGHLIDFYRASSRNLRDRIARALPMWSEDRPGYSIVLGMYAFGLEEAGDFVRAEAVGRDAVARDPRDCWAHHAVAHVMEMQGRAEDGIGWMQARAPHWSGDDNFFRVHNWWHKALCHLDLQQRDEAMSLYDQHVRGSKSTVALDLADAAALLWRIQLDGYDVGARWDEVATCWDAHADGKLYPFNDWHAAMAYLGSGRVDQVDRLIERYRAATTPQNETALWGKATGLPLIEGFRAFWQGRHAEAMEHLHAARFIVNSFGGSHAQRDIIDWTLTEAAIRSGNAGAAQAFAHERLAMKPHSPVNRQFLARARALGSRASLAA